MGLKFSNFELQMINVMKARKLTNACVINSIIDICIFQVSITVFKEFSRLFHTYNHFQGFSRP